MSLKLSEAIRLGAMLKPQGTEHMYHDGKTCAFGAAIDAVGELDALGGPGSCWDEIYVRWPWVNTFELAYPQHRKMPFTATVAGIVLRLNDEDRWTREQIADWVQTIEPAEGGSEAGRAVTRDVLQPLGQMTGGVR